MNQGRKFSDEQVATLLGSHLLVGITYLRPDGGLHRRLQFHGTVESVGEDVVEVRRADNGEIFTLPPAPEAYKPAPPGEYRLKTGEVVVNPDFTCTYEVHPRPEPHRGLARSSRDRSLPVGESQSAGRLLNAEQQASQS
jgi:hypothetical protein